MRIALVVLTCLGVVHPAWAQSGENVAVVINDNSAQSRTIGEYYAAKRNIPSANIFHIQAPLAEVIDRATFTDSIEWPLRSLVSKRGLQDRVLYIVLTKDVPLRISGTTDAFWTAASVDSELTLLYRRMTSAYVATVGHIENPYFLKDGNISSAKPFTHRDHDIVLVSRLDGTSVDDVLELIDRAAAPSREGVLEELSGATPPLPAAHAARFAPGSISAAVPSYRATSFRAPSSKPARVAALHSRPPAAEVADLIRRGATAVAGDSREDVPGNPARTDILFGAYLAGANAVEAFYLALPYLSANTIIIGDPLCAPFRPRTLTRTDIEAGEDPDSSLPRLFAARRIATLGAVLPWVPPTAIALALRAVRHFERGEPELARTVLEQATEIAPQFASAQFNLGTLNQGEGDYEHAIERYRLAIAAQRPPAREEVREIFGRTGGLTIRVAALNNLAYLLAVHLHQPAEALPFATKAAAEAAGDPFVVDTLAWIEYLLGDKTNAEKHIRAALAAGGTSAAIHLHAAAIFATSGARTEAEAHLREALRLQPDLDKSGTTAGIHAQLQVEGPVSIAP